MAGEGPKEATEKDQGVEAILMSLSRYPGTAKLLGVLLLIHQAVETDGKIEEQEVMKGWRMLSDFVGSVSDQNKQDRLDQLVDTVASEFQTQAFVSEYSTNFEKAAGESQKLTLAAFREVAAPLLDRLSSAHLRHTIVEKTFRTFDADNNSLLDVQEYEAFLNYAALQLAAQQAVEELRTGIQTLTQEEVTQGWKDLVEKIAAIPDAEKRQAQAEAVEKIALDFQDPAFLAAAGEAFSKEAENGAVPLHSFCDLAVPHLQRIDPNITPAGCIQMFEAIDVDGSASVDAEEFQTLLSYVALQTCTISMTSTVGIREIYRASTRESTTTEEESPITSPETMSPTSGPESPWWGEMRVQLNRNELLRPVEDTGIMIRDGSDAGELTPHTFSRDSDRLGLDLEAITVPLTIAVSRLTMTNEEVEAGWEHLAERLAKTKNSGKRKRVDAVISEFQDPPFILKARNNFENASKNSPKPGAVPLESFISVGLEYLQLVDPTLEYNDAKDLINSFDADDDNYVNLEEFDVFLSYIALKLCAKIVDEKLNLGEITMTVQPPTHRSERSDKDVPPLTDEDVSDGWKTLIELIFQIEDDPTKEKLMEDVEALAKEYQDDRMIPKHEFMDGPISLDQFLVLATPHIEKFNKHASQREIRTIARSIDYDSSNRIDKKKFKTFLNYVALQMSYALCDDVEREQRRSARKIRKESEKMREQRESFEEVEHLGAEMREVHNLLETIEDEGDFLVSRDTLTQTEVTKGWLRLVNTIMGLEDPTDRAKLATLVENTAEQFKSIAFLSKAEEEYMAMAKPGDDGVTSVPVDTFVQLALPHLQLIEPNVGPSQVLSILRAMDGDSNQAIDHEEYQLFLSYVALGVCMNIVGERREGPKPETKTETKTETTSTKTSQLMDNSHADTTAGKSQVVDNAHVDTRAGTSQSPAGASLAMLQAVAIPTDQQPFTYVKMLVVDNAHAGTRAGTSQSPAGASLAVLQAVAIPTEEQPFTYVKMLTMLEMDRPPSDHTTKKVKSVPRPSSAMRLERARDAAKAQALRDEREAINGISGQKSEVTRSPVDSLDVLMEATDVVGLDLKSIHTLNAARGPALRHEKEQKEPPKPKATFLNKKRFKPKPIKEPVSLCNAMKRKYGDVIPAGSPRTVIQATRAQAEAREAKLTFESTLPKSSPRPKPDLSGLGKIPAKWAPESTPASSELSRVHLVPLSPELSPPGSARGGSFGDYVSMSLPRRDDEKVNSSWAVTSVISANSQGSRPGSEAGSPYRKAAPPDFFFDNGDKLPPLVGRKWVVTGSGDSDYAKLFMLPSILTPEVKGTLAVGQIAVELRKDGDWILVENDLHNQGWLRIAAKDSILARPIDPLPLQDNHITTIASTSGLDQSNDDMYRRMTKSRTFPKTHTPMLADMTLRAAENISLPRISSPQVGDIAPDTDL